MSFFKNHSNWPLVALKDVATLKRGYDLPTKNRVEGDVPIYAANGINGSHNEVKIMGPGVITGRSGTIGKVHFTDQDYWPLNTSLYVTDFHGNNPKWVFYMLRAFQLERFVEGAGVPTLNRNLVHDELIPLPPLEEQKRIAAILDKANAIRQKRKQAIDLADEFLRSVFLDMFGDPLDPNSKVMTLPMTEVFNITTGKLNSNAAVEGGQYPFFTCAKEIFAIDDYAFEQEALLLAGNNAQADYDVKHFSGKFNAYQRTYVLTLKDEQQSYPFYKFALEYQLKNLKRFSKGSNTKYITMEIMERTMLPVPSNTLQHEFVQKYSKKAELLKSYSLQADFLNSNFNSLSQKAFSGQL
ncbi:restriction endonuclease subunit S [Vibrio campbellii]|uniref:restriction endonuclease subunit S n=1 Tax=Vibrio campbellii TaxID=680 RepID=UPI0003A3EFFF|nr:restriction endonuclease subunit S [Vibrio campbellii]